MAIARQKILDRDGRDPRLWRFIGQTDTQLRHLEERTDALEQTGERLQEAIVTGRCRCGRAIEEGEELTVVNDDGSLASNPRYSIGAVTPSPPGSGVGESGDSTADEVAERLARQSGFYEPYVSDDSCLDLVLAPDVQAERPGVGWVPRSVPTEDEEVEEEIRQYIASTRREGTPDDSEDSEGPSVERSLELFEDY